MKNTLKATAALLALAASMAACKGGVSGEKTDSTMVNKQVMDSTATMNSKAGTMAADSNSAAKRDSNSTDSAKRK